MNNDTIAAIATGLSVGGIGIIRVSGEEAIRICDEIFGGDIAAAPSHQVQYGHIFEKKSTVDEVLVTVFRAPRSYTKEDVVEISCHGGLFVQRKILDLVIKGGARPAEPGEFTKRAFLNGRIDLSQAESVMDIISSEGERMLKNSLSQLDGFFSREIRSLREEILQEVAYIESAIDDPEHYDLENYSDDILTKALRWKNTISAWIGSANEGRIIRDGIRAAIVGKPNAGKSSLLNALLGSDRAIVTDIPGTTRDIIEERVRMGDLVLVLEDTAGIRNSDDEIERIGIDKSFEVMSDADVVLYVVDGTKELDDADLKIMEGIDPERTVILLNKMDLVSSSNKNYQQSDVDNHTVDIEDFPIELRSKIVQTAVKQRLGMDALEEKIREIVFSGNVDKSVDNSFVITNVRHVNLLSNAENSLNMVLNTINNGIPEDFYTVDLMEAYTSLGLIIGEEVEDDLVDKIFSEFCMGK